MIALIDYKAGNLTSVKKALAAVGAEVFVPEAAEQIAGARGVIVPGVGHFAATRALDDRWVAAILEAVGSGRPLLGICLGMQWLFDGSDEAPDCRGLGLLGGRCYRLSSREADPVAAGGPAGRHGPGGTAAAPALALKVPHVGWNALDLRREAAIVEAVPPGAQVYFTHSYVAPLTGDTVAATEHGEPFASIVQRGQVAGVQFHPEKSGEVGLQILRNFMRMAG